MKKKLMIAGPVLLLVLAFVAKTMFLAPAPPDLKALAKEPGPTYTLKDPFVVNLADGNASPHFAKVGVALRFSMLSAADIIPAKGTAPATTESDAELRDIVIATLQKHTSAQLSESAGRDDVKKQIVEAVNKRTKLKILDVYYTEFAVQ
jgi:flagellar basal body-associated protein FliL